MEALDRLDKEFRAQGFSDGETYCKYLDRCKQMAYSYAQVENAIAVLSDWRANVSYIYYGRFAKALGVNEAKCDEKVYSVWEEDIFRLIHEDDLTEKHLQELCFFHFIKQLPRSKCSDYYLASKIRMKDSNGNYIVALHRVFYISVPPHKGLWLVLCLYSPLVFDMPSQALIVNSVTGHVSELKSLGSADILSVREKQVLALIDKGMMSKEIAATLSISVNTVSRHRQEILGKLKVKNSIEACRIAKDLHLI